MTNEEMEQEANLFAMELLMPAQFLERDLEKYNARGDSLDIVDGELIRALAIRYGVSDTIMTIRLTQLGIINI